MKSNKFLKVTGILMIIGGTINTLAGSYAVSQLAELYSTVFKIAAVFSLLGGIVGLFAGIIGVKFAARPEKAMMCIICGCIVVLLTVISNIIGVVGGDSFNFLNLALGLLLPGFYLKGAFQNKKMA